ncbi:MAG: asparagine synthase (glutamine-hydrolyzing) [Acidobacteriota bacterium]|nr:asparagine synthase (glutamine-hydrolyzing) [Acidobacteriota bacterium]
MCGLTGILDLNRRQEASRETLEAMTRELVHRGPDSEGFFSREHFGLGFRRLSIIDLETGDQPIPNEDGNLIMACNGEIYNFKELRAELEEKGHRFRTNSDAEVVVHLYEEHGPDFCNLLNGQFALAVYDIREDRLMLARDHFGIQPMFYTVHQGVLLFASEIKAILQYPGVPREADLTCLDQVMSFPGHASPRTMFKNIHALKPGHFLLAQNGTVTTHEYWDLVYPEEGEPYPERSEEDCVEEMRALFEDALNLRLQADVPVGFYLSGGLDSSMAAAMIYKITPHVPRHAFSVTFRAPELNEERFQKMMATHASTTYHQVPFNGDDIAGQLYRMIRYAEGPVKETYNTCSLALSEAVRRNNHKVVISAEGADELFAGYPGYKFDRDFRSRFSLSPLEEAEEDEMREKIWGSPEIFYEKNQHQFREDKLAVFSEDVAADYDQVDFSNFELVNKERLSNRHYVHQRSYLDFKLRMADHLLGDHGDRMAMANSVEARYPFLDIRLVDFARRLPPELKLKGLCEKYIVKKAAEGHVPREIIDREKFGFRAPSSPELLQRHITWLDDLLSPERIARQGFFNPDTIAHLKKQYTSDGFQLHFPYEVDWLIIVLTFNIFLDVFKIADYC